MFLFWILNTAYAAGLILTAGYGIRQYREFQQTDWNRYVSAFLPAALWTVFVLFAERVAAAAFNDHNWMRLQKTFALAYGYPVYYGPDAGPALTSLYGPVSYLIFLPSALITRPDLAVMAAGLITLLLYFLPAFAGIILPFRHDRRTRLLSRTFFLLFCFVTFLMNSLKKAAFDVHVDAPTLFLSALACVCLYFYQDSGRRRMLFLSAPLIVLSVWTKQTAVPLMILFPAYLLLLKGWREALFYSAGLLVTGFIVTGLILIQADISNLFFNILYLPSRHPFKEDALEILVYSAFKMFRECIPALILYLIFWTEQRKSLRKEKMSFRQGVKENPWIIFIAAGIFLIPTSLLAFMKVGGSNNNLAYPNYFFMTGLFIALLRARKLHPGRELSSDMPGYRILLAVTIILFVVHVPIAFYRINTTPFKQNFGLQAYRYLLKHPDRAYFPRVPLVHLVANNKLYHDSSAVLDRRWGRLPITREEMLRYMPSNAEVVAFFDEHEDQKSYLPLEQYAKKFRDPELPNFRLYKKGSDAETSWKEWDQAHGY